MERPPTRLGNTPKVTGCGVKRYGRNSPSLSDKNCVVIIYQNGKGPERFEVFTETGYGDIKIRKFVDGNLASNIWISPKVLEAIYQASIKGKKPLDNKIIRI